MRTGRTETPAKSSVLADSVTNYIVLRCTLWCVEMNGTMVAVLVAWECHISVYTIQTSRQLRRRAEDFAVRL